MANKETVKALFMEHYDRMYMLARIMLHDDEESRDAVSDVFARIADGSIDVREESAKSFLLTCVRNKCLKMIRAKQVRQRASRLLQMNDTVELMPIEKQTDRLEEVLDFTEKELPSGGGPRLYRERALSADAPCVSAAVSAKQNLCRDSLCAQHQRVGGLQAHLPGTSTNQKSF